MLTDKLFIVSLALLALLALGVLGLVLHLAARQPGVRPPGHAKVARIRFDSLRSSFRQAVALIEGNLVSGAQRYAIPWILVLDESADPRPLPIAQSGVSSALGTEAASAATTPGISWHFFDRGVVIDIKTLCLGAPDDHDSAEKPWDEFLGLCRAYRPSRPFDSVVLTLPAHLLAANSVEGRLELARRAKQAHRRLWLAQNRFAMRFAVYVVVTDAEQLGGFGAFARALPEPMRASMLGWSSPYDLSTSYQAAWVDEAMGSMLRTVSDTSAELCGTRGTPEDVGAFLLLPARIQALQTQLQLYIDEVMRPSAYHEPFFFRGIYFTGDIGDAPVQRDAAPTLDLSHGTDAALHDDLIAQLLREPVFLRDLFEKKIFAEYGLTRASSNRHLARPMLHRVARWTAITVLSGWGIGLAVSAVNLHRRNVDLVATLDRLNQDAQTRTRASQRGETLPSVWYRERALSLLALSDQPRSDTRGSVFMPGSWPVFDPLDDQLAARIEHAFGDIAVTTLHRELLARAVQITGASQDDSTGEFVTGGDCSLPPAFAGVAEAPRRDSLAPESLPEFAALQRYVVQVDQLDAAMQAMDRLRSGGSTEDLRLVVHYALGAELPQNIDHNLRFFKRATFDGAALPSVKSASLVEAVRCAFDKGAGQLRWRLFTGNPLLLSESRLTAQLLSLTSTISAANADSLDRSRSVWRDIVALIKDQDSLVGSGTGSWMRQSTLNLGPAWDRLVARVAQARLLGDVSADRLRDSTQSDFQRFQSSFVTTYSGTQSGIIWQDKEGRFALSADRAMLRDALAALMAQPFINAPTAHEFPAMRPQALANWNQAALDQALAVAEIRKRFMAEGLPLFPVAFRSTVQVAVDTHLAHVVIALTSSALVADKGAHSFNAESDAEKTFDSSRQRLSKVSTLLSDLGESSRAEQLRQLISRDALARLRQVDEDLIRSEPFMMRETDFTSWQDGKDFALAAFGVNDQTSLAAYLAHQNSRVETLSKQANIYLASLDAADASLTLAQRWHSIENDLEQYRMKNPNSRLLQLNQYLLGASSEIYRSNCTELQRQRNSSRSLGENYFSERKDQISIALVERCRRLKFIEQQEYWQRFSKKFNSLLSSRYPFVDSTSDNFPTADISDVRDVLNSFEPLQKTFKTIEKFATSTQDMQLNSSQRRFINQFEAISSFLKPLVLEVENGTLGYDIMTTFRTNVTNEINGDKIIDWSLDIGGKKLNKRDAPRTLHWEYGMPVTIILRLAKDSPLAVGMDPQQAALNTDGQVVIYKYRDPWALIDLVRQQRESKAAQKNEDFNPLLKLEFPVVTRSAANIVQKSQDSKVRVYFQVHFTTMGGKTPLSWPAFFPSHAPN